MSILQGLIASIKTGSPPPGPYYGSNWEFNSDDLNHGSLGFDGWWTANGTWMNPSVISGPSWNSYTYYDGSTGHTYDFNGSSDYLISPQITATGAWPTNAITVQMWFYPTANGIQLLGELGTQDTGSSYHYSMLEIDSSGYIKAVFWNGTATTSTNTVTLNQWNHVYFTEDTQGGHTLEVNGIGTYGNPVYTRTSPMSYGTGYEYFVVGLSDTSNIGNSGRFQGKIGIIEIYDSTVGSNYSNQWTKFQAPPPESGTAGTSIVWQSDAPPASGTTWAAAVGTASADIYGSSSVVGSGSTSGMSLSPGYVSVPVNLNRGHWTVELVCELNPYSYWATIWGNESWNGGLGYISYLTGSQSLSVGSSISVNMYTLGNSISSKAHWVFANNAGTLSVYRNGVKLSASSLGYSYPSGPATNNLFIGARHVNEGTTSPTDFAAGTYYFIRVRDYALDATGVANAYDNDVKTLYSLP